MRYRLLISLFVLALLASAARAQTTEFTYQGSLKNGATAATGNFDFEFLLFDASTGGTQIGSTITENSVAVASGTFAVKLDFASAFPGASRFLEIHVRQTGGGAFTPLTPRQSVSSAPYAVKSLTADSATNAVNATNANNAVNASTATNALQLGGLAANQYVFTGDSRLSDARAPTAGSTNYIQNTPALQQTSNFNISGNGTVAGNLLVGSGTQNGKLSVNATSSAIWGTSVNGNGTTGISESGWGVSGLSNSSSGVRGKSTSNPGVLGDSDQLYGVYGITTVGKYGVKGYAVDVSSNFGDSYVSKAGVFGTSTTAYGVAGTSDGNYGVFGAGGSGGVSGYSSSGRAVFASSNTGYGGYFDSGSGPGIYTHSTSNYGIFARSENTHAIYVDGSSYFNRWIVLAELRSGGGTALCRNASNEVSSCSSSSIRYKKNIGTFNYGVDVLKQLRPIAFDWRSDGTHDIGLAAEEVAKVAPQLVVYEKGHVEGVKYDKIGMVLINAVKEQQAQIEALKTLNRAQQKQIDNQEIVNKKEKSDIQALKALICRSHRRAAVCRTKN